MGMLQDWRSFEFDDKVFLYFKKSQIVDMNSNITNLKLNSICCLAYSHDKFSI